MKFSIRDLLLVTVIVAILVAWWIDRRRLAAEIKELRSDVEWLESRNPLVYAGVGGRVNPPMPNPSAPAPNPPKD
jgi:hypothetical protein